MFEKTQWFAPDLTLDLRDYGTAILFAMGPGSVREALESVTGPVHLQVQRDVLDEVTRLAAVSSPRLMWRMIWTGDRLAPPGGVTTRLGASDVPALRPSMPMARHRTSRPIFLSLDGGRRVFHGIYEGTTLVAAAGTHLLAREEGPRRLAISTPGATAAGGARAPGDERGSASSPASRRSGSTSAPTTPRRCISTSRSASRATASSTRRWRGPEIPHGRRQHLENSIVTFPLLIASIGNNVG